VNTLAGYNPGWQRLRGAPGSDDSSHFLNYRKDTMKEEENKRLFLLKHMLAQHDITYTYSDDNDAFKKGQAQHVIIKDFVAALKGDDKRQARIMYNKHVDKTIAAHLVNDFYWGA
jgi:uncharacterized membrane protein YgaE (UPF0421/DUF939 family)